MRRTGGGNTGFCLTEGQPLLTIPRVDKRTDPTGLLVIEFPDTYGHDVIQLRIAVRPGHEDAFRRNRRQKRHPESLRQPLWGGGSGRDARLAGERSTARRPTMCWSMTNVTRSSM